MFCIHAWAQCRLNQPVCGAGELPTIAQGECCLCRPAPPVCTPGCGSSQVCVPTNLRILMGMVNLTGSWSFLGQQTSGPVGECVGTTQITLQVKEAGQGIVNNPVIVAVLASLTSDVYAALIVEMVDRFCENNGITDRCYRF